MTKQLGIQSIGAEKGEVLVGLATQAGRSFELRLPASDVPVFVGELNAARDMALGQRPGPAATGKALRIQGLGFGEDDSFAVLRIQVNEHTQQDFAAEKGSPLAIVLARLAKELAAEQQGPAAAT